ncbi:MAG: sulfotransferase [Planctomycetota bacterium]
MRLPDFLIIGAMKAGTTTLFADLGANPGCYFPRDKEPGDLARDEVLTEAGRAAYARHFEGAPSGALLGEASTVYTKRPDFERCAERARRVLGPDLKLLYIVRDPISRALSQHYHEWSAGELDIADASEAIRSVPRILEYSRYAMQLEPWLDAFGSENLMAVRFEDYIADRASGCERVSRFLGLEPRTDLIESAAHNKGDEKMVLRGPLKALWNSWPYQKLVRPVLGSSAASGLKSAISRRMPKAPPRPAKPSSDVLAWARTQVEPDLARLPELLGAGAPAWPDRSTLASSRGPVEPAGGSDR